MTSRWVSAQVTTAGGTIAGAAAAAIGGATAVIGGGDEVGDVGKMVNTGQLMSRKCAVSSSLKTA